MAPYVLQADLTCVFGLVFTSLNMSVRCFMRISMALKSKAVSAVGCASVVASLTTQPAATRCVFPRVHNASADYGSLPLLLVALFGFLPATVGARFDWESAPRPLETESPVQVRLLVLDDSGSMPARTRSARVRAAAGHAISTAEKGTYVIVATFGATARVVAHRFVLEGYDREVLLDAVEGILMDAQHTDVAVLEHLIEGVRTELTSNFGPSGFRLEVEVLTDGKPDPAPRKNVVQTFNLLLGQPTNRTALGDGLFLYRAAFESLSENPTATINPTTPTSSATAEERTDATPARQSDPTRSWTVPIQVRRWQYSGAAIAALLFALLLLGRFRGRRAPQTDARQVPDPTSVESSSVFIVTETEGSGDDREVLRDRERVSVVREAAVAFGTDAGRCACIAAPIPGIEDGEFFRLALTRRRKLQIRAIAGTLLNNKPVPKRGLRFRYCESFRVSLGGREWLIALEEAERQPSDADDLFELARTGRGVAEELVPGDA